MTRDASKIILDLGGLTPKDAIALTHKIGNRCYSTLASDLFDLTGGNIVLELKRAGAARVGIDAKLHDKPEAAARRAAALAKRGAQAITAHASGGRAMLQAIGGAIFTERGPAPAIYANLLTSGTDGVARIYSGDELKHLQVNLNLALEAKEGGVDGIICPPQHIKALGDSQGIRGMWIIADLTDKVNAATPRQAIKDGADYIIIGHQITEAQDPEAAFGAIEAAINPRVG